MTSKITLLKPVFFVACLFCSLTFHGQDNKAIYKSKAEKFKDEFGTVLQKEYVKIGLADYLFLDVIHFENVETKKNKCSDYTRLPKATPSLHRCGRSR